MSRLVIALLLAAGALAACGKSSSSSPPVSLSGTVNNHGKKDAKATMEVELDDFYMEPTFIKASAGQTITLELKNEGKATHTFTSTELGNVDEELAPGATKTISVTAPASGHGLFYCRFHQGQGMQGAIYIA